MDCTLIVRQYGLLKNKRGFFIYQKERVISQVKDMSQKHTKRLGDRKNGILKR